MRHLHQNIGGIFRNNVAVPSAISVRLHGELLNDGARPGKALRHIQRDTGIRHRLARFIGQSPADGLRFGQWQIELRRHLAGVPPHSHRCEALLARGDVQAPGSFSRNRYIYFPSTIRQAARSLAIATPGDHRLGDRLSSSRIEHAQLQRR